MNGLSESITLSEDAAILSDRLPVRQLIAGYPGPAALFHTDGTMFLCNDLVEKMAAAGAAFDPAAFSEPVRCCSDTASAMSVRRRFGGGDKAPTFDIDFVPMAQESGHPVVLLLARDVSYECNLNQALVASRALLQDLVGCSADFAWQTDAEGRFSFVSPRGALGLPAADLVGRQSDDLLRQTAPAQESPFRPQSAIEDEEHWLAAAEGSPHCMRISALPVTTADGMNAGARGVCRDVTLQKIQEAALERGRRRETMTRRIVDAIRNTIEPEAMLGIALRSVAPYVGAGHGWITRGAEPWGDIAAVFEDADNDGPAPVLPDRSPAGLSDEPDQLVSNYHNGRHFISIACCYQLETQGWITLAWAEGETPPPDGATVLRDVAAHIGIAIAQSDVQGRLERLSSVDELTGLMNRRACLEVIEKRLAHHQRHGRAGALVYIDFDNFKPVNDVHGHEIGDKALRHFGRLLNGSTMRRGDVAGRLGGDEFVVWLEETDLDGARSFGEKLLTEANELRQYSAAPDAQLTLSIGVAATDRGTSETILELVGRADAAMYQAKRAGKRRLAITETNSE
jgi:diguanylate cyclase (GGDEF)-like protein/PAS domain S-box-containing protein